MTRSADRSRSATGHRAGTIGGTPTTLDSARRTSRTGARGVMLAALTTALVLSACGGGGEASGDDASENPDDPRNSPVAQLLGFDVSPAEQRAKDLEVQQATAECMQDEGWEYEPVDYQAQMGDMNADWEEQLSDPEGFGEKYGYGVVRSYESQGEFGSTTFEDPNQDYISSLTPDENEAYYETLYGKQSYSTDPDEEFVMPALEDQGCTGKAMLAVHGENSAMTNTDLQERMNDLFTEAEDDPALAEAIDEWADCMREQDPSYEYERPEDAQNEFWNRLNELQGFGVMPEGDDSGMVVEGTVIDASSGPTEIDEADLEDLRQEELRTWRHDWDCQQEADIAGVRRDVEQRIVDDLLAEFPELAES